MNNGIRIITIALLLLALNGTALELVVHPVLAGSGHQVPVSHGSHGSDHDHHSGHHGADHDGESAGHHSDDSHDAAAHQDDEVCHHNGLFAGDDAVLDQELRTLQAALLENPELDQLDLPHFIKLPAIREIFQPPIEHPPQAVS